MTIATLLLLMNGYNGTIVDTSGDNGGIVETSGNNGDKRYKICQLSYIFSTAIAKIADNNRIDSDNYHCRRSTVVIAINSGDRHWAKVSRGFTNFAIVDKSDKTSLNGLQLSTMDPSTRPMVTRRT